MRDGALYAGTTCLACARRCDLRDAPGDCGVRRFGPDGTPIVDDAITHAAVQCIEDKPIYHFRPGSRFFTVGSWGCGTRCAYCRNAETALARRPVPSMMKSSDVVPGALAARANGIAFSFNEPLVRAEQVHAICSDAHRSELATVVVTSGFATDRALALLAEVVDAWRVDIKAATAATADEVLGAGAPWSSSYAALRRIRESGAHVEVSLTYSPTLHGAGELARFGRAVARASGCETPVHIQPLLPAYRLRSVDAPTLPELEGARDLLRGTGLEWVYVHLLGPTALRTTYCACGAPLVERNLQRVRVHLDGGACANCRRPAPIRR